MPARRQSPALVALVAVAALSAFGCSKSPNDRLVGKWTGDGLDHFEDTSGLVAIGWVKGAALEFTSSKVTVTVPAETPRAGTYRVSKVEGDRMVVSFTRAEGGARDEATFTMMGEDKMRWELGEGRAILLARSRTN